MRQGGHAAGRPCGGGRHAVYGERQGRAMQCTPAGHGRLGAAPNGAGRGGCAVAAHTRARAPPSAC
eukprot:6634567-Prymnesium_polylepis.2